MAQLNWSVRAPTDGVEVPSRASRAEQSRRQAIDIRSNGEGVGRWTASREAVDVMVKSWSCVLGVTCGCSVDDIRAR